MNNELLRKNLNVEQADQTSEWIGIRNLGIVVTRSSDGIIKHIQPCSPDGLQKFLQQDERTLSFQGESSSITVETQPSKALSRENSGHPPIPLERQMWVVDIAYEDKALTCTIPVLRTTENDLFGFTALEDDQTRQHPLTPFDLQINHPDIDNPKTDIVEISQIFGHMSAAARLLEAMPEITRAKTSIAARNIENVPRVVEHMKSMGLGHEGFMVPLVYDDSASGGANIQDRKAALWWLIQNPELVDQFLQSKIILSDLREETALLKHIADSMNFPQIFIALTYGWPQELNHTHNIHPDLQSALDNIPTIAQKLEAMDLIGLTSGDAVLDWFSWAKTWKAGIRDGHAHGADIIIDFSLVDSIKFPVIADNIIMAPPRTHLETNNDMESSWNEGQKRILVLMGSGDWTEREQFVDCITQAATLLPDCQLLVVGPIPTDQTVLSENISFLGYIPPSSVDGLIKSCDISIIKPGHFSLEETAGKLTLIAPPDNLTHSIEIARTRKSPRSVAITVEVDEERLTTAIEEWLAIGSPQDFSPLLDITTPELLAKQIAGAFLQITRFSERLNAIPHGGTQFLVEILENVISQPLSREAIPSLLHIIKIAVDRKGETK